LSIAEGLHVRVWLGNAASESDTAYDVMQNLGEGMSFVNVNLGGHLLDNHSFLAVSKFCRPWWERVNTFSPRAPLFCVAHNTFSLLSQCSVHCIMDGEAMDTAKHNGMIERWSSLIDLWRKRPRPNAPQSVFIE